MISSFFRLYLLYTMFSINENLQSAIAYLPSHTYPIFIYLSPFTQSKYSSLVTSFINPYILTIGDSFVNDKDIASLFISQSKLPFKENQLFFWQQETCFPFINMTMKDLANKLQKQLIQGISLQVNVVDIDRSFHQDIACFLPTSKTQVFIITFYLPFKKQYFCLDIRIPLRKQQLGNLYISVEKYLQKELKIKVKSDKIKLFAMWNNTQTQINNNNCMEISKHDQIVVKITQFSHLSKISQSKPNDYIVFKVPFDNIYKKIPYIKGREMRIQLILDNLLEFRQRGLNSKQFGVKINNTIIMPQDNFFQFGSIETLFTNRKNQVHYIYAQIIKPIDLIHINSPLNISNVGEYMPEKYQNNQPLKLQSFTNCSINNFLRCLSFQKLKNSNDFRAVFKVVGSLINWLKQMPLHKGVAHFSVNYEQAYKVGERLHFKQFITCSLKQTLYQQHKTLYIIQKCQSARIISQFDSTIIFIPNCSFKIVQIISKNNIVYLQEQPFNEYSKPQQVRFLWLNKEITEGVQYSKQSWIIPHQSTSFIHLTSTTQFQDWLKGNAHKSGNEKLVLITNMVRDQNQQAGADAIKVFLKYREQGQFFVYVGRAVEDVLVKLRGRGIRVDDRQVSHKSSDLQTFVKDQIFKMIYI